MLSGRPQLQPSFSLHVEFGGGAATWSGHGIAFQQKVPVTRHVGFEVSVSTPCTLHFTVAACSWVHLLLLKPGQMGIPCCLYTEAVLHHGITLLLPTAYSDPGASPHWQCTTCVSAANLSSCRLVKLYGCQHLLHTAGDWINSLSFAKYNILTT